MTGTNAYITRPIPGHIMVFRRRRAGEKWEPWQLVVTGRGKVVAHNRKADSKQVRYWHDRLAKEGYLLGTHSVEVGWARDVGLDGEAAYGNNPGK